MLSDFCLVDAVARDTSGPQDKMTARNVCAGLGRTNGDVSA